MLTLISPSKTLDETSEITTPIFTLPSLLNRSAQLIETCKKLTADEIATLMKISPKLASLNFERFQNWHDNFSCKNARQAIFTFKGDVYEGLNIDEFNQSDLNYAQDHLKILSGLYGLLKPLDLIMPYRLEMGVKLKTPHFKNLYQFWGDALTHELNSALDKDGSNLVVNLASNEYFKVINPKLLKAKIITPVFLDESKGQFKVISFYAKKARGLMSRFIMQNRIDNLDDLRGFSLSGYQFNALQSNDNQLVFLRHQ